MQQQQLPWRIVAIILAVSLGLTVLLVSVLTAYYNGRVRIATRNVPFPSNDTSLFPEVNVRQANVEQLCFSEHPYCFNYDDTNHCVGTYGTLCLNDVNIGGRLNFVGSGGFGYNQTSFISMKIGDLWFVWNGSAVVASGAPLHNDIFGLPLYFDPDRFAGFLRQGNAFVINATYLKLLGHIIGNIHVDNLAYFHDRIYLGNGVQSIIYHGPDGLMFYGNHQNDFLDNLIGHQNFTVHGRVVGNNLNMDDNIGIDMHGTHSYITHHEGDLDICATNGKLRLCGNKLSLAFNEINIVGDITNTPHFLVGIQADGTSLFDEISVTNINAATITTTGNAQFGASVSAVGPISSGGQVSGSSISVTGSANYYNGHAHGPQTVDGTFTANGQAIFYGSTFANGNFYGDGPLTDIGSDLFLVTAKNVSMVTEGPISFNTTKRIYLQSKNCPDGNCGICLGDYNSTEFNMTDFCAFYFDPNTKQLFAHNLTITTGIDFLTSEGDRQSTIGSAQYTSAFGPAHGTKLLVIDSDIFVNGFAYGPYGFGFALPNFVWDPPHSTMPSVSDRRFKENIRPSLLEDSVNLLQKINIFDFTFKKEFSKDKPGQRRGVMAQDLADLLPRAVYEEAGGYLSVDYSELIPDLINVNKFLLNEVKELRKELALMQAKLDNNPFHVKEFNSAEERDRFFERQPRRKPVAKNS